MDLPLVTGRKGSQTAMREYEARREPLQDQNSDLRISSGAFSQYRGIVDFSDLLAMFRFHDCLDQSEL
jgi:hypothetical protein